ncbi:meiosis-specific nuclear structural protein 1-like [Orussus abietinus]|uniref:meiosis-specific nuclear structural protein 1-like n=1 Tax=Orussus abietinus TaxID=222816 RepID=UPI000626C3B0|nr:meiosis-specific nuclear structural protein 1-like [Orussus abietinus]
MEETLKQRKKDEARENLARELKENEALAEYERRRDAIQERGKLNDFKRNLHTKRREACREEKLRRDQRTADLTRQKTLRAEKLAHELSQLKNAELVKEKRRQLLRESSEELRQLEVQLRSAYAAKEVHLQILEKEAKRKEERRREREAFFVDNWSLEDARQLQLQDREKKHKYRREIQDQLIGNYRRRQEDSEEKQREGKLAEELSQVLREEGEALKNRKLRKAAQLRAEEEAFFRARGIWKEKEKEALEDEHYRLQEIIGKKETEEKERLEKASPRGCLLFRRDI